MSFSKPVLYVSDVEPLDQPGQEAIRLLDEVQCDYELKRVPITDEDAMLHGLPWVLALNGIYAGVPGVKIFIQNAIFMNALPLRPSQASD